MALRTTLLLDGAPIAMNLATDKHTIIADVLNALFFVQPAVVAFSLCNIAATRKDISCGVHSKFKAGELIRPMVSRNPMPGNTSRLLCSWGGNKYGNLTFKIGGV
jgi:hypothetical protein